MRAVGGGGQVTKLKPRRLPPAEDVLFAGSSEPPRDACEGLVVPCPADWRRVRLAMETAVGILAADADSLNKRLTTMSPDAAIGALASTTDILSTWSKIVAEARDRLLAIHDLNPHPSPTQRETR